MSSWEYMINFKLQFIYLAYIKTNTWREKKLIVFFSCFFSFSYNFINGCRADKVTT